MRDIRVTSLDEDLKVLGLGDGLKMGLLRLEEADDKNAAHAKHNDDDYDDDTDDDDDDGDDDAEESVRESFIERVAGEVFERTMSAIEPELIDYDRDVFESQLYDVISALVREDVAAMQESELSEGRLEEVFRRIAKLVGGRFRVVRQKLTSRSERRKAKMQRRRKRGKIRMQQRKQRRKASFKRYQRKAKRAMKTAKGEAAKILRRESDEASELWALLTESDSVSVGANASALAAELDEAYGRVWRLADTLSCFFEDHGEDEDLGIAEALTHMVESMEDDVTTLSEAVDDPNEIARRLTRLQTFGKVVERAASVFGGYEQVGND